jgi:murein DD-endopeptidase MepM/ murein hydrolase activator NlpD
VNQIDAMIAQLRVVIDELSDMKKAQQPAAPARVLFGSPCTGSISTTPNVWGLDWFDATGYAMYYSVGYHTGCDLNRPNYADSGRPVFAAADSKVAFAGVVPGWQGQVIVLKHWLEDGALVWTRYAHVRDVCQAEAVKRGNLIGYIADYNADGPKGDHLHFDVARIDLGAKPGDWPGMDKARLLADYIDPQVWLKERAR